MTRPEIQAEIQAQKELMDTYAAQVEGVFLLIIKREDADANANRAATELANGCNQLAKIMKKLNIGMDSAKRFFHDRNALYYIEQELNRK